MNREVSRLIKHALDRVIASVAIVVLAPVLLPIAILIKLDSHGPVFFRQERVGHLGRPFRMYKFRSMVHNAEQLAGGYITRLDSPMVTRTGRALRLTSFDELPQLINVLRGEMSLVGPRPLLSGSLKPGEMRRQDMRPGCTSLPAVSGRQSLDWDERIELDLWYVDNWSLWLDAKIILKTIPVALSAKNVYDSQGEMKPRANPPVSPPGKHRPQ